MGHTATRILVSGLLLLASAACSPDFEKFWQVTDLRVLAVTASPPELLFITPPQTFPPVRITALVTDPIAPDATVDWELWACTPEKMSCAEAFMKVKVSGGTSAQDKIAADFVLSQELYQVALGKDTFKGFGGLPIKLELRVKRGSFTSSAVKRVVYGLALPPGKWPNNNPSITEVLVDGQALPDPWVVEADKEVVLLPKTPSWDKEIYQVLTYTGVTPDCLSGKVTTGCSRTLEEYLTYSYFATSGKIGNATTGGKPKAFVTDKKVTDISTEWTPDSSVTEATIWIVVHDDRGGTAWFKPLEATVTAPKKK